MINNSIRIDDIKRYLRNKLSNDNSDPKKLDKKILKIINSELSLLVYDYLNSYILEKHYKDMHYNTILINIKSKIDLYYYTYKIEITNEYINDYVKYDILQELYRISAFLEYDETFHKLIVDTFKKVT